MGKDWASWNLRQRLTRPFVLSPTLSNGILGRWWRRRLERSCASSPSLNLQSYQAPFAMSASAPAFLMPSLHIFLLLSLPRRWHICCRCRRYALHSRTYGLVGIWASCPTLLQLPHQFVPPVILKCLMISAMSRRRFLSTLPIVPPFVQSLHWKLHLTIRSMRLQFRKWNRERERR